jgi:hypothetical protein
MDVFWDIRVRDSCMDGISRHVKGTSAEGCSDKQSWTEEPQIRIMRDVRGNRQSFALDGAVYSSRVEDVDEALRRGEVHYHVTTYFAASSNSRIVRVEARISSYF